MALTKAKLMELIDNGDITVNWADIADPPEFLSASDLAEWAKAENPPAYTAGDVGAVPIAGGTVTGTLTSVSPTNPATQALRKISAGTGNPSGGSDGDIYIKYV